VIKALQIFIMHFFQYIHDPLLISLSFNPIPQTTIFLKRNVLICNLFLFGNMSIIQRSQLLL